LRISSTSKNKTEKILQLSSSKIRAATGLIIRQCSLKHLNVIVMTQYLVDYVMRRTNLTNYILCQRPSLTGRKHLYFGASLPDPERILNALMGDVFRFVVGTRV
jgi:hypothetical protein